MYSFVSYFLINTCITKSRKAPQVYDEKIEELQDQINGLNEMIATLRNTNPDKIDWGHVGDLQRMIEILKQVPNLKER